MQECVARLEVRHDGIGPLAPDQLREARAAWRRGQIIEAATRLLERNGFHGMSMHMLAEEAGVSVGLIYQYVPRKEDVLLLVIVDILEAYKRDLPVAMAAHDDHVEKLAAGFDAYCRVLDARRAAALLAYRESVTLDREGRELLKSLEIETTRLLAEVIEEGSRRSLFTEVDADLVAYDLVMLAHAWALKHWYYAPRISLDDYIAKQFSLVLNAIVRAEQRDRYRQFLRE